MSNNFNYNKKYNQKFIKKEPIKETPVEECESCKINIIDEEEIYEVCSDQALNFRIHPSTDSEVRELLKFGDRLILVQDLDDWLEVKFGDLVGFVMTKYVKKV